MPGIYWMSSCQCCLARAPLTTYGNVKLQVRPLTQWRVRWHGEGSSKTFCSELNELNLSTGFSETPRKRSQLRNQLTLWNNRNALASFSSCAQSRIVWINVIWRFSNRLVGGMPHSGGGFRSFCKASWTQLSELVAERRVPSTQLSCPYSPMVICIACAWLWHPLEMPISMDVPLQSLRIFFLGFLHFALRSICKQLRN